MKGFLLDTNIASELTYPRPAPQVKQWLEKMNDEQLFFSVISLAEICKGIAKLPESKKAPNYKTGSIRLCARGLLTESCRLPKRLPNGWDDGLGKAKLKAAPSKLRTV